MSRLHGGHVYSPTIDEHLIRLTAVFWRLKTYQLVPDKCEFLHKEVAWLEHLIIKNSVKPNLLKDNQKFSTTNKSETNQRG